MASVFECHATDIDFNFKPFALSDYFQFAVGNYWTYEDKYNGGQTSSRTDRISGIREINGVLTYVYLRGDKSQTENYYTLDSLCLRLFGFSRIENGARKDYIFNQPLVIAQSLVLFNTNYQGSATVAVNGSAANVESSFIWNSMTWLLADGFVYHHLMDELFFNNGTPSDTCDDYGRTGFNISYFVNGGGESFIYSYYAGTANVHFKYTYSDRLWSSFVDAREYESDGVTLKAVYATELSPEARGAAGDANEWDQRAAVRARVESYGSTQAGGYVYTPAMAGETPGVNPFNGQAL